MTIVADLFATLGLQVNESQFAAGTRRMKDMTTTAETQVGGFARVAGGLVSRFAPIVAGFFAVNEIKKGFQETLSWDKSMTDLAISSGGAVKNLGEVTKEVLAISDKTGVTKEQLLSGAQAFITLTGDAAGARAGLETFARVAKGSGADMSDVTRTAGAMSQQFGILPEQMEKAFSILIAGGKAGAVELKDLSQVLAQVAPLAAEFKGGQGLEGVASTGAALQLIAQGTGGNANMAVTRFQSLMNTFTSKAKQIKDQAHVDVQTWNAEQKRFEKGNLMEIVTKLSESDLARDPAKLLKLLGSVETYNAYVQLVRTKGAWNDMTVATQKANDVAEDYATRSASRSERVSRVLNRLKNISFDVFNQIADKIFTTWDSLMNGSFFKDWPVTWDQLWKTIGKGWDSAINTWTNAFDGFSENVLGGLGGFGEELADNVWGLTHGTPRDRALLIEEGKVRGLKGKELGQFVNQGIKNDLTGNPDAAKADIEWRKNYNREKSGTAFGAYGQAMKNLTVNAPVTVNVTGTNATADEIGEKVKIAAEEVWRKNVREAMEAMEATGG